jgi:putative nucleotidyltransferase with HDIG domain
MIDSPNLLTAAELKGFSLLEGLSSEQLEHLVATLSPQTAGLGARLLARGSDDGAHYLLLKGEVKLVAGDGRVAIVKVGTPAASRPLAQLRPRLYDVVTLTEVRYLRIEDADLAGVPRPKQQAAFGGVAVAEEDEGSVFEGELYYTLHQDLEADRLVLPSLPDVAVQVSQAIEDEVTNANRIAAIIQSDPAITAKLIKAANSALFAGREPVNTCSAAVVRLGVNTVHKLVVAFALRELFQVSSKALQKRMREVWGHSTEIGALCYVLARKLKRFSPEQAMLAGLLHDIGKVAILSYAERFPELADDTNHVDMALQGLHAQIGGLILRKWKFTDEYVTAALEADHWNRDASKPADYCDLVVVSQLHSWAGTTKAETLPAVDEVASFKKLGLEGVTEEKRLAILEGELEQLDRVGSMLQA